MMMFRRKTRLITRDDLTIDWRTLYRWAELIYANHDATYALVTLPKFVTLTLETLPNLLLLLFVLRDIDDSLFWCVRRCSSYFSATATQEILDQFRPQLYPIGFDFSDTIQMFQTFLPVNLPPYLHSQGFKLVCSL